MKSMAPCFLFATTTNSPLLSSSPSLLLPQFKRNCLWRSKCKPSSYDPIEQQSNPEPSTRPTAPSPSTASTSVELSVSTYNWCAGIGAVGFFETAYLTYLKITNSDAFCPASGSSCQDVLTSDYASVFGVPLSLMGMAAYGLVAAVGLQLSGKKLFPFEIDGSNARLILLATTTSMATASGYFMYILATRFSGVSSCTYCLFSAVLSFALFFITLKNLGMQEIQKLLGLQLCVATLVIVALNTTYGTSAPVSSSLAEVELQYFNTDIATPSTPLTVSLARHLHSIGAKMYGAFWCSHCQEQKEMFGKEASKLLDYVECFPDGYKKGTKIAKACADAKIEGFPTWIINGQVLSGEQELSELAQLSGFNPESAVSN